MTVGDLLHSIVSWAKDVIGRIHVAFTRTYDVIENGAFDDFVLADLGIIVVVVSVLGFFLVVVIGNVALELRKAEKPIEWRWWKKEPYDWRDWRLTPEEQERERRRKEEYRKKDE